MCSSDLVCVLAWWDQGMEVGLEDVGFDDLYIGVVTEAEAQFRDEGTVEFYRDEALGTFGEDGCDGSVAGADLDDGSVGDIAEGICDAMAGCVVGEEVLA